jgi:hypothetical protein
MDMKKASTDFGIKLEAMNAAIKEVIKKCKQME